ncbi:hypothetical protein Ct61P_00507 [Colletotrichum tofieldiae]|nr:hypothetical protein Ct61P_00507 [Colletotrichum tofieldiae]
MHEQILKKIEDEKATRDQLLERLNKSRNLIAQWEQLLVMSLSAPSPGQDTNKGTKTPDTTNHNETFKGTPDATKSGGKVNGEPVNSQHPPLSSIRLQLLAKIQHNKGTMSTIPPSPQPPSFPLLSSAMAQMASFASLTWQSQPSPSLLRLSLEALNPDRQTQTDNRHETSRQMIDGPSEMTTTSDKTSYSDKNGSHDDDDSSFAALQLPQTPDPPSLLPFRPALLLRDNQPAFRPPNDDRDDRDDRDARDGNHDTRRSPNATVDIGLRDSFGSVRCMLLSPEDAESAHNKRCCLLQKDSPLPFPHEPELQHPELKRRRHHQPNASFDNNDDSNHNHDKEVAASPAKRHRCSLGTSLTTTTSTILTPTSASTNSPDCNYIVYIGLVKLYPTEHDVLLNHLHTPSTIHQTQEQALQTERPLLPLASLLRRFNNLSRLRSILVRAAACIALTFGLAVLLCALPSQLPLLLRALDRKRPSRDRPDDDDAPPVPHLDLLALHSANLVRYASVPRILSLGLPAEASSLHGPDPPAFACNSAGHFVPEEYFLLDLRLVLNDVIWDLRRHSTSAEDDLENPDNMSLSLSSSSLAALQQQMATVLSRLAILSGKTHAMSKNWSLDACLASSSRLLELVEIRKSQEAAIPVFKNTHESSRDTIPPPKPAGLTCQALPKTLTFRNLSARHGQRTWLHEASGSRPGTADGINKTHLSLLTIVRRPLVTADLKIFTEAASPNHDRGSYYARAPREQVLVLYAAVLDDAYALLSELVARVDHVVAVVPDPMPPDVTPDEGMRSLLDKPAEYGIARVHRATPFLHSIALARLADMRDRALSAVAVLRNVVAHQSLIDRSSDGSRHDDEAGAKATFPGWPAISVDVEFTHRWVQTERNDVDLATKLRQVHFMVGLDTVENEDEAGRAPDRQVWSRWGLDDNREDPYVRDRMLWWQRGTSRRQQTDSVLGKVPSVIRNLFTQ